MPHSLQTGSEKDNMATGRFELKRSHPSAGISTGYSYLTTRKQCTILVKFQYSIFHDHYPGIISKFS